MDFSRPRGGRGSIAALQIFLLGLFASRAFAQTATPNPAGRVVEVNFTSAALEGNLLGDPALQRIAVYLPPSYAAAPNRRYPVVYLLHGYDGSSRSWTTDEPYSFNVPPLMDALIASGAVREMIIVAPTATNSYHGSFYANSTVTGNWEDYIFRDVVAFIDANYRTLSRASSRGIAGHSMGGYGAIAIGMKHADVFSVVYAHAPCCLALSDTAADLAHPSPIWKSLERYTARADLTAKFESEENLYENIFVAMAAAFSPNASRKPFFADFPFEERGGRLELNKAVYAKWRDKTPIYLIDRYKDNLLRLRGLAFELGTKESFEGIRTATPRFAKALADRGLPFRFEIYEGGTHESMVKERLAKEILPYFSEKLDFAER